MSEKLLKEAFISNLNGTSCTEISMGLSLPPLCLLCRGLLYILHYQKCGESFYSWKVYLLLDFFLFVLPLVVSCTVLSNFLHFVPLVIATMSVLLLCTIYRGRNHYTNIPLQHTCKSLLKAHLENETVPAVTTLRVFINVFTAVSILAVDFPVFPRRYAKTETYGTGVMDFGVGCFIFSNALVSPEAKMKQEILQSKFARVSKQLLSVWPLILLGFGRLISVKAIEYHEHVSEYGVHWNFFFTLAIVRVLTSLLLTIFPARKAWIIAAILVSSYQAVLETTTLKRFVLHGSDGMDSRVGFLNANREGIFSIIGYVAIYMAGVQVGLYVLKKRTFVKEWMTAICNLMLIVSLLFVTFYLLQEYVELASRRMANITFCVWVIAFCLSFLSLILLCDLILVFAKYLVTGSKVPCTWNVCKSLGKSKKKDTLKEGKRRIHLCLIDAVNRNQLLFFLQSNIMTGIVNKFVDTIHSNTLVSISVLLLYMFTNCMIMYILHINEITVKWW
ncbi:glucosaminyl-phosphatidylinositol-acyltransferase PIGW [Ascaphus truei]|uniref:glucosaminyl-phosphatidylinositol- acyltransferase PIGW n=1 Tax=Ascaphus truei TaxID=8439 RepID=UPI003F5931AD